MNKAFISYCSRCGKERVISRVWKEKVGTTFVENIDRECPDKKCQQTINRELKNIREKRLEIENRRKKWLRTRKTSIKDSKEVNKING